MLTKDGSGASPAKGEEPTPETYTTEQLRVAQAAWEKRHPDQVSNPKFDAVGAAWMSGYIAALNDTDKEEFSDRG